MPPDARLPLPHPPPPAADGGSRRVTWLELFFDVTFVAAVAQAGSPLGDDYSLGGLARYVALFVLIWWAWVGHTTFSTRFGSDDGPQRVLTLIQMCAVVTMAINAKDALDSRSSAGFAVAYAAMRFVLAAQYFRARQMAESRALTNEYLAGLSLAATLWLVAALVPVPVRFWIWGLALVIDLTVPLVAERHSVEVPPDAEHIAERYGLFTLILLGEGVVAIMHGMESQHDWSLPAATSAFVGIGLTFLLWWWYFDGAKGASEHPTETRRDVVRFRLWSLAHLPFYVGIAVTGVGMEHIVRGGGTTVLHQPEALILSVAAIVVMASLWVIGTTSMPHRHSWPQRRHTVVMAAAVVATLGLGTAAPLLPPPLFVIAIAILCALQLRLALATGTLPAAMAMDPVRAA